MTPPISHELENKTLAMTLQLSLEAALVAGAVSVHLRSEGTGQKPTAQGQTINIGIDVAEGERQPSASDGVGSRG